MSATLPAHDPAGWRQLPTSHTPLDHARVSALMAKEWERYAKTTTGSADHAARSSKGTLPLGVTSSFQYWDPYPMGVKSARGAYVTDCDDRQVLDLSMGFGAMLVVAPQPDGGGQGQGVAGRHRHAIRPRRRSRPTSPSGSSTASVWTCCASPTPAPSPPCMRCARRVLHRPSRKPSSRSRAATTAAMTACRCRSSRVSTRSGPPTIRHRRCLSTIEPGVVHTVAYNDLGRMERKLAAHAERRLRGDGAGDREPRHHPARRRLPRRRA